MQKTFFMNKYFLTILIVLGCTSVVIAQTTAPNFTTNDCEGISHDLYTELDEGKVVIIAWVMPCGACIGSSLTAYNVSQSYVDANPGRIAYYLVDDYGNTDCTTLTNWGNTNGIGPNLEAFSTTDITMTDFGSIGMPKVVIMGGPDHTIYFNENGYEAGNVGALEEGINLALAGEVVLGINNSVNESDLQVTAVVISSGILLSYELPYSGNVSAEIFNVQGQMMKMFPNEIKSAGIQETTFQIGDLPHGIYFLKFKFEQQVQVIQLNY